jgi:predicted RNase H-like nuclease
MCDVEARKLLGIRRSSVFPSPIREVLYSKNYEEANTGSKRLTGKGISKQTFGIIPKIIEVDEFIQSNQNSSKIINEAHPEVCFVSLAGGVPMKHNKKTQDGFQERIEILRKYWQPAEEAIAQAFLWCSGYKVARDDIVDALVLAIVATHSRKKLISIPQIPPVDDFGIPMQMVSLAYKN